MLENVEKEFNEPPIAPKGFHDGRECFTGTSDDIIIRLVI